MTPVVSIIIPTYNRAYLIGETLDSVIAQTYSNWECIVVDDGSKDYTDELLEFYSEKDQRIKYHHRPANRRKGANACRNFGFELSRGEYINWFDSDDLMSPDKLKIQIEALEYTDFNYSICQTIVFKNSLKNVLGLRSELIHSEDIFYDYLSQRISWLTQAPLWKKKFLLTQRRLFDEDLQAAQEWEFHSRILAKYPHYQVEEKPLVFIRQHTDSLTYNNNTDNRIWNYFLARLKIYKNSDLILNSRADSFLKNYLLRNFKSFTRSSKLKISVKSLFHYIYTEKNFTLKIKLFATLSVISYLIFGKGHFFLKRVNYLK